MSVWGIILAAGLGVRMGTPKAFLSLDDKPMLLYSLESFQKSRRVSDVVVVCRKEDEKSANDLVHNAKITKCRHVVEGGKERQDSVLAGLSLLPKSAEIVAVHDAARPLASTELIDTVIDTALEKGASLAAIRVKDTVKIARKHQVENTLDRETLWYAQTPQAFRVELFKKALLSAAREGFYGTDCASLVERIGTPVYLVEGTPENMKVTSPSDILMAEALLRKMHV